jgi:hypothetical protein
MKRMKQRKMEVEERKKEIDGITVSILIEKK